MKVTVNGQSVLMPRSSEPIERRSLWTPSTTIHGYRFPLHVSRKDEHDLIQDTFLGSPASIEGDEREYLVDHVHMNRSRFTDGGFVDAEFEITIVQEDVKPTVKQVQINGKHFGVAGYKVNSSQASTVHSFLIEVSTEDFDALEQIVNGGDALAVQRIGVDGQPFSCRIGGGNYWSSGDEESDSESFIRIVNCVIDHEPPGLSVFPSAVRVRNLEAKVALLTLQMRYLLERLKGVLTEAELEVLDSPDKLCEVLGNSVDKYWTSLDHSPEVRQHFET